jgi:hypothetical protein
MKTSELNAARAKLRVVSQGCLSDMNKITP